MKVHQFHYFFQYPYQQNINGSNVAGTAGPSCIRRRDLFVVVGRCHTGVDWSGAYL